MLPADSISNFMCEVNENSTKNCTPSKNFDKLEVNDVLENIRLLLNYIKKRRELQLRARMGGWAKHAWILDPSLPAKKSAIQKIFGSNLQLTNQKVSVTAHPLYAALRAARQNPDSSGSLQLWAHLYELARTYFTLNP